MYIRKVTYPYHTPYRRTIGTILISTASATLQVTIIEKLFLLLKNRAICQTGVNLEHLLERYIDDTLPCKNISCQSPFLVLGSSLTQLQPRLNKQWCCEEIVSFTDMPCGHTSVLILALLNPLLYSAQIQNRGQYGYMICI